MWAPAKTSDHEEQLHQDIDTWYDYETLRNDRGDTKNDDSWYTCLPDFWIWRHSSSKIISARNEASKNIQKLCAKSKTYHGQNEHTSKIRKWKAAQNDDQNDDRTMTIFLVYELLRTHAHRESAKMASLLVRNYSFFIAAAAFSSAAACSAASATASFQSLAHFISTNTKPSGT